MITLNTQTKLPAVLNWYLISSALLLCIAISLPLLLFFGSHVWAVSIFYLVVFLGLPVILYELASAVCVSFVVTDHDITKDAGILIKSSKSVSYNKVQNVVVVSGVLMRAFGLARVNIWTASQSQLQLVSGKQGTRSVVTPDVSLVLLDEHAKWLKTFITQAQRPAQAQQLG